MDCAQMLKKCGASEEAIEHYREASNAYARLGRLAQAAKHLKEIGETCESLGTAEADVRAVEAYSSAADLYDGEGDAGRTTGNNCKTEGGDAAGEQARSIRRGDGDLRGRRTRVAE